MKKYLVAFCTLALLAGCGGNGNNGDGPPILDHSPYDTFLNKAELDSYLVTVKNLKQSEYNSSSTSGEVADAMPDDNTTTSSEAGSDQVETNNQSIDVDEGDIIKFAGNHMIILRDQHLLILDISGSHAENPVILTDKEIDADFGKDNWGKGAWYDEMLIFDTKIVLIAYRFNAQIETDEPTSYGSYTGAIEILKFNLSSDGSLDDGERLFIESNDYYSGARNYASRKIDNHLIIYSPFYAAKMTGDSQRISKIPYQLELIDPKTKLFKRVKPTMDYTEIFKGSTTSPGYMLHAIYSIDLNGSLDSFQSTGVMGEFSRVYYITQHHFYLNLSKWCFFGNKDKTLKSDLFQFQLRKKLLLKNMTDIQGRIPERFAIDEKDSSVRMITQGLCSSVSSGNRWILSCILNAISLDYETFDIQSVDSRLVNFRSISSVRFNGSNAIVSPYSWENGNNLLLANFTDSDTTINDTDTSLSNLMLMQPYEDDKWVALEASWSYKPYSFSFMIHILGIENDGSLAKQASHEISGDFVWSEAFANDHAFFFDPGNNLIGVPYASWLEDPWEWERGVQYFHMSPDKLESLGDGIIQTGDTCKECWYGNSRVVRKDAFFYNLLGRQVKVSTFDASSRVMEEVSTLDLFE